jgi:hypothetical protein
MRACSACVSRYMFFFLSMTVSASVCVTGPLTIGPSSSRVRAVRFAVLRAVCLLRVFFFFLLLTCVSLRWTRVGWRAVIIITHHYRAITNRRPPSVTSTRIAIFFPLVYRSLCDLCVPVACLSF